MSETEDLKKATEESRMNAQFAELNAYMKSLHENIDYRIKNARKAAIISVVVMTVWIGGGLVLHNIYFELVGIFAYFMSFGHMALRDKQMSSAVAELKGALKVLRIMGLIDYDWDSLRTKKRRPLLELVDMVKGWATKKKEMQEKGYAPA